MLKQPWRGPPVGALDETRAPNGVPSPGRPLRGRPALALPPGPMPRRQAGRPLKRWSYLGVFGSEFMICAGTVAVGGLPQSFWALWDRAGGSLDTETFFVRTGRVRLTHDALRVSTGDLRLELAVTQTGREVEVVSPHGGSYIWTRKRPVTVLGHVAAGMEVRPVIGEGLLDESAGYHARHTDWEWSAGSGVSIDGQPVTWNLVRGIHDSEDASERTVWVEGRPVEVPPVRFSTDLDEVWGRDGSVLMFVEEASRSRRDNFGVLRSDYEQPFGRFYGTLPGGIELAEDPPALGVMERHHAVW